MDNAKKLADEHWAWVVRWLEMVYKDAFIHGFKHGKEDFEYIGDVMGKDVYKLLKKAK